MCICIVYWEGAKQRLASRNWLTVWGTVSLNPMGQARGQEIFMRVDAASYWVLFSRKPFCSPKAFKDWEWSVQAEANLCYLVTNQMLINSKKKPSQHTSVGIWLHIWASQPDLTHHPTLLLPVTTCQRVDCDSGRTHFWGEGGAMVSWLLKGRNVTEQS